MYIFDMTYAVHAVSLEMMSSPLSGFDHMTGVSSGVRAHTCGIHMFYMCHTRVTPAASPIGCCHVASKGDIKRLMCAMACDIGGDMAAT